MNRAPITVLPEEVQAHPAVQAWAGMGVAQEAPTRVDVLVQFASSAVYRLVDAGPGATSVIAKRSPPTKLSAELAVYERVLPHLDVTHPRYYGSQPTDGGAPDGDRWIFLEDVGTEQYSDSNAAHLALAAGWVARMHRAAADLAAAQVLPDGGPSRYLAHLRAARDKIERRLAGPDLTADDVTMLHGVVAVLNALESCWSQINDECVGLPATLVHGDFRPKNVYLRANGSGLACYPIDWETAGWGVPAADLTRIDLSAYWAAAREWLPGLQLETAQRLRTLGQAFCAVAGIDWESIGLRFDSRRVISRQLSSIEVLVRRLAEAARTAGVLA